MHYDVLHTIRDVHSSKLLSQTKVVVVFGRMIFSFFFSNPICFFFFDQVTFRERLAVPDNSFSTQIAMEKEGPRKGGVNFFFKVAASE